MTLRALLAVAALLVVAAGWQVSGPRAEAAPSPGAYSLQPLITSAYLGPAADAVIEFAMIPGHPNEAIVAEQSGYIYRVALDGSFPRTLWGDVHTKIAYGGEQGLLSVAFAPDFVQSGRVYMYYTPGSPTPSVLARFQATEADLDESSEEVLLNIDEFAANHNGGHIAFDGSGYLYLSLGDGGGSGDPQEHGQSLTTLDGKVLRIDVSGASGYAIPAGNPFSDGAGPIREEIFAYGFRNPFRMTIDPVTDDVWVGDVGQDRWEEVDRVTSGGNYGWDCWEGNEVYESTGCPASGFTAPLTVYDHSLGQAITGGVIYRGTDLPELYGWYVYADFYSGRIWAVDPAGAGAAVQLEQVSHNISSFTLLAGGEIAVVTYGDGVYRLTALDADGDGIAAASDNCPARSNPSQALPSWTVPNDDADCDGLSTNLEDTIGTLHDSSCAATSAANDEPPPDAWPPDLDDSQAANLTDIFVIVPKLNTFVTDPGSSPRYDLSGDGAVNLSDIFLLIPFLNMSCVTGGP